MKIELELWHLITLVLSIVGAFWGLGKMLINIGHERIGERFDGISSLIRTQSELMKSQGEDVRRIERDLMGLKAELPRDYVRREDYTQTIATIMTKIDHATLLMQQAVRDAYTQAAKAFTAGKDHHQ